MKQLSYMVRIYVSLLLCRTLFLLIFCNRRYFLWSLRSITFPGHQILTCSRKWDCIEKKNQTCFIIKVWILLLVIYWEPTRYDEGAPCPVTPPTGRVGTDGWGLSACCSHILTARGRGWEKPRVERRTPGSSVAHKHTGSCDPQRAPSTLGWNVSLNLEVLVNPCKLF